MKKIIVLLLALTFSFFAQAQNTCGITREQAVQNILQSKALAKKYLTNGLPEDEKYIPIKFHLVGDTDGQNRVTVPKVLQTLCEVNQEFDDVGFTFYIKDDFHFIDNSVINSYSYSSSVVHNLCAAELDSQAINIFIVKDIIAPLGTPLTVYDPTGDWIVVKNSYLNKLAASHGLGHFFSLLHPFFIDMNYTVGSNAPITMEIDTSSTCAQNCETVADLICDTPPDYISIHLCTNLPVQYDYCGTEIHTMQNNIMSYYTCDNQAFTTGQALVMQGDYLKPSRDYIRSNYIPNSNIITQSPTLVSPANHSTVAANPVTLDWSDVPYTSMYLVEISKSINFSIEPQFFITTQSELTISLNDADKYHWRVTPFNEAYTCTEGLTTITWSFQNTVVNTSEILDISNWALAPNPTDSAIRLTIQSRKKQDLIIQLIHPDGRLLSLENKTVIPGLNQIELPQDNIASGAYIIRLISGKASECRKIIIN